MAQCVRASSAYAKVVGSVPGQDTYKSQPMSVCELLSLSLPLLLSLSKNKNIIIIKSRRELDGDRAWGPSELLLALSEIAGAQK